MDKNTKNVYIDIDGTLIDTVTCIVNLYNEDFEQNINPKTVKTWNFEELSSTDKTTINNYFEDERFFERVEFFEYAKNSIILLAKLGLTVNIVTLGTSTNLTLKENWLKKNLPKNITWNFIGVDITKYKDKSHIDMSDGVAFIDDDMRNLSTSNCPINICYGEKLDWNKNWDGLRFKHWNKLCYAVLLIAKNIEE